MIFGGILISKSANESSGSQIMNGAVSVSGGRSDHRPQYSPPTAAGAVDKTKQV